MDSHRRGSNTGRWLGLGILGTAGLLYGSLFAWEVVAPTPVAFQEVLNLVGVGTAVGLLLGTAWLFRTGMGGDRVLRVVTWALVATVPLVVVGFVGLEWQAAAGASVRDGELVVWYLGVMGTMGGFLIGVYDVDRRRSKVEFRALVEAAPTAIVAIDPEGRVTTYNESAEEMFGWTAEEARGSIPPFVPEDRRSEFLDLVEGVVAGQNLDGEHVVRRRKDGSLVDVEVWTSRVTESDGELVGIMTVLIDVTDQRRRDQALSVLRRILRHNLRNDGDVIIGHSRMIAEATDSLSDAGIGGEIRHSAEEIEAAATDLVTLGEKARRVETVLERQDEDRRRVDLCETFQELREEFGARYPDAEIDLSCEPDAILTVTCRVSIVFQELVENAIEHAECEDPTVRVQVEREADWIVVRVADDGPGVPDVEAKALEEPRESALVHTSGLGLWLVNWLVSGVGGTLSLEKNDRGGCTAVTRLPTSQVDPGRGRGRQPTPGEDREPTPGDGREA